jgi:nitroimidazol reductase NimA-like FMN-containing flavoprotein (pyridoxamine 5'-phosphate oxidase superfamily)
MPVDPVKIPRMPKPEYDALIERQCVSRISFGAGEYPYTAPFMYVFDKKYLYFLSTKYGRKMKYFAKNPNVSVEIEENAPNLSVFSFVSLQGTLEEVTDPARKMEVRQLFVEMIAGKKLSPHVLTALGHNQDDRPDVIAREERSLVWRLIGVKDIVALKNG